MSKKYKLLKDLPDLNAGAILVFDGKTHYDYIDKKQMAGWYEAQTIENNPEWFEEVKEKERIEVMDIGWSHGGLSNIDGRTFREYGFNVYEKIPEEKIPLIKEAIEKVLNDEPSLEKIIEAIDGKLYTQGAVDELCKDAFNAARELIFGGKITGYMGGDIRYKTFQDYKSKQNP